MQRVLILATMATTASAFVVLGECQNDAECRALGDGGANCADAPLVGNEGRKVCFCSPATDANFGLAAPNVNVCVQRTNGVSPPIPVTVHARYQTACETFDYLSRGDFKRLVEAMFLGVADAEVVVACSGNVVDVAVAMLASATRVNPYGGTTPSDLTAAITAASVGHSTSPLRRNGDAISSQIVIDRQCKTASYARYTFVDAATRCQPTACDSGYVLTKTYGDEGRGEDYNQWQCVKDRAPYYESDDDLTDAEIAVIVIGAVLGVVLLAVLAKVAFTASNDAPAEVVKDEPVDEPVAETA